MAGADDGDRGSPYDYDKGRASIKARRIFGLTWVIALVVAGFYLAPLITAGVLTIVITRGVLEFCFD